jgi:hypothetical protein
LKIAPGGLADDPDPSLAQPLPAEMPRDIDCFFMGAGEQFHVPGFAVDAVDTAAAGDTFNAGLGIVDHAEKMPTGN